MGIRLFLAVLGRPWCVPLTIHSKEVSLWRKTESKKKFEIQNYELLKEYITLGSGLIRPMIRPDSLKPFIPPISVHASPVSSRPSHGQAIMQGLDSG